MMIVDTLKMLIYTNMSFILPNDLQITNEEWFCFEISIQNSWNPLTASKYWD